MARPRRTDAPGTWHHVMNRGIARRTVFERRRDVRYFLAHLARVVREGWIEVHAYSVLTTHYHLLVRSPEENLSRAMGQVSNNYVRWFNRGRRRDGPLFRGRFCSRPVDTLEYRRQLVRYIDGNPVGAGLVASPALHPYGSAQWYATSDGPPWLERTWIEADLGGGSGPEYDPSKYTAAFGAPPGPALERLIERRVESGLRGADPLDDLLRAAPERVLDWMRRKAALADGTRIDLAVCEPDDVLDGIRGERAGRPNWRVRPARIPYEAWELLEIALVRDLCATPWAQLATLVETTDACARRHYRVHAHALEHDAEYAATAARLACAAIARCYGASEYRARNDLDEVSKAFLAPYRRLVEVVPGTVRVDPYTPADRREVET